MMTRLRSRIYVSSLSPGSLKKRLIHCFECAPREFLFDISTLVGVPASLEIMPTAARKFFAFHPHESLQLLIHPSFPYDYLGQKSFSRTHFSFCSLRRIRKLWERGKRKERINRYGLFLELCRCNSRSICHHLSLRNFALTRMNYWQKKTPIS